MGHAEDESSFEFAVLDEEINLAPHEQNEHCLKIMHNHGKRLHRLETDMDRILTVTRLICAIGSIFGAGILAIGYNIAVGVHQMSISNAELVVKVGNIENRIDK